MEHVKAHRTGTGAGAGADSRQDVTGSFGAKTRTAVEGFQTRHHLTADGKVDKKTWRALLRDPAPQHVATR
ncbi:peptidoglycan-binding protein [Streptomyces sp. VTCC 41912]|uniref:peptidoglycan-binding domain-containing protein n=1 Tax=Streptomyces sp. VTCC 41912 TaxID=3383243 RepID=UPI003896AF52